MTTSLDITGQMRRQEDFRLFLGIDQTGAAIPGSNGSRARPLPWAALTTDGQRANLFLPPSHLDSLRLDSIESGLNLAPGTRVAVILDCVLGLPREVSEWNAALDQLARSPMEFGRAPAHRFFSSLLMDSGTTPARVVPTRLCEQWARANSVFRDKPYQKNIQTGTFRLWRDLTTDPRKAEWSIWPFDRRTADFTLFEGYPTFMWKQVAGFRTRSPADLARWLEDRSIDFNRDDRERFSNDPDLADAVMLAAAGYYLHRSGKLLEPFPNFFESELYLSRGRTEGWIAGLAAPT